MQYTKNYSSQKVLIGLSGGINSMALLCHLANQPDHTKPKELHFFLRTFQRAQPGYIGICVIFCSQKNN